jgi:uncharacterized OB-fold protein
MSTEPAPPKPAPSEPAPPKPAPVVTPETAPFWEAAQREELQIQRCNACGDHYFYPRPFCPACFSEDVSWVVVSGRATLVSYVINHRPVRGWEEDGPYAIAVVQLEEGPRMATNIVGIPNTPEDLALDMPLQVCFVEQGGMKVPKFGPPADTPPIHD